MKRNLIFALTAVLAITFASCNNQSSQSSQPSLERQYIVWSDIDTIFDGEPDAYWDID